MGIVIKRNFGPLTGLKFTTKDDMMALGRLARERIIRRTVMGVAPGGAPFHPYSKKYAERKAKELGSASPVDLQVSGEMLRGITVEADEKTATLSFTS